MFLSPLPRSLPGAQKPSGNGIRVKRRCPSPGKFSAPGALLKAATRVYGNALNGCQDWERRLSFSLALKRLSSAYSGARKRLPGERAELICDGKAVLCPFLGLPGKHESVTLLPLGENSRHARLEASATTWRPECCSNHSQVFRGRTSIGKSQVAWRFASRACTGARSPGT